MYSCKGNVDLVFATATNNVEIPVASEIWVHVLQLPAFFKSAVQLAATLLVLEGLCVVALDACTACCKRVHEYTCSAPDILGTIAFLGLACYSTAHLRDNHDAMVCVTKLCPA